MRQWFESLLFEAGSLLALLVRSTSFRRLSLPDHSEKINISCPEPPLEGQNWRILANVDGKGSISLHGPES